MSTWFDLFGMKGYYQSEIIELAIEGSGTINSISWDSTTPSETSVRVFTSYSVNGGYDWTEWKQAVNGGSIPDTTSLTPMHSIKFRYRVFLDTSDESNIPIFNELSLNFEPVLIFDNKGDSVCTPEIWITKTGNGDFALINTSNGNEEFKFTSLINNETVYVNSEREYIETDLPTTYRYSNFNDNYLRLPYGANVFRVQGSAKIQFRYQYKLI